MVRGHSNYNRIKYVYSDDRLHVLDTFRGLAAFAVACGHFGLLPSGSYIYAVDFFLVLSGFILTYSYFAAPKISFLDFAMRRFFRMYPLHAFSLTVVAILYVLAGHEVVAKDFYLHLFFVQNLGFGPDKLTLNLPAWTISIEFWINVIVYAAVLILKPNRITIYVCASVCIALFYVMLIRGPGHLNTHTQNYWGIVNSGLVRCFGAFLIGMITYYIYERFVNWRPSTFLMVVAFMVFSSIILTLPGGSLVGFTTPFLFGTVVVIFALGQGWLPNFLSKLSFLGDISFSIYLFHYPIILVFEIYGIHETAVGVAVFPFLIIGVAALVHRYFEKPVYKYLLVATKGIRARLSESRHENT